MVVHSMAELAMVTAVSLFAAAAVAGSLLVGGEVAAAPELVTRYLAVDRLGLFFDLVICVGAGLSALLAGGYLREHGFERGEFYVLVIFTAFGAMVLARAGNKPLNSPYSEPYDFFSSHTGKVFFLFADTSVHGLNTEVDLKVLHALATRNGSEDVSGYAD